MSTSYDAYTPAQIAVLVNDYGVKKAGLPLLQTAVLGILAGAFIAFGGMFYTLVITDSTLGFGPTRLLGGLAFSLGLVLVIIAGAELFTGNNLLVIAWAERRVSTPRLLRNWGIVYLANFVGAFMTAWFVAMSGILSAGDGAFGATAAAIAAAKLELGPWPAFVRGLLCNALVCLAVWLSYGAHSVAGKIPAIMLPIAAFVALGLEHSIANMYLIGLAFFDGGVEVTVTGFIGNLLPVTLGNILGGSVFVALVYWVCYLRHRESHSEI